MMNILALSLVLTTLLTATVHSPPPLKNQEDVIVKEGHRVVMVEFDEHGTGNTKVSISENDEHGNEHFGSFIKDKMSALSGVVGGTKEKLKDDAAEMAKDVASKSTSRFWGAAETAKDSMTNKAKQASGMAGNAKSRIEGGAKGAAEMTRQGTAEMAKRGKGAVGEAIDTTKNLKVHVERNVKKKIQDVLEKIRSFCMGLLQEIIGSMRLYMRTLQLFGFATAYGMAIWVTFLSNYMLAKVLPRQQFAFVQSKIYPLYFKAMSLSVGVALFGHMLSEGRIMKFASFKNVQGLNLLSTLLMILANLLYFEPRSSKVMFERLKLEKEEGMGVSATTASTRSTKKSTETVESDVSPTPGTIEAKTTTETTAEAPLVVESGSEATPLKIIELSEALKKLHSCSSFLNMLTLMGLTLHLVNLGQRLGSLGTTCY